MQHSRESIRLKEWEYSSKGSYFITICVQKKRCVFGKIKNDQMYLSEIGQVAKKNWENIPKHFGNVQLSEFIIMPNHVHGIIDIGDISRVGVQYIEPLRRHHEYQKMVKNSIGSIIRSYKASVTREIRQNFAHVEFSWQRNYYERIIRTEEAKSAIAEYTILNPLKWALDRENPEFLLCL